jgi:hypothetical protein
VHAQVGDVANERRLHVVDDPLTAHGPELRDVQVVPDPVRVVHLVGDCGVAELLPVESGPGHGAAVDADGGQCRLTLRSFHRTRAQMFFFY